LSVVTTSEPFVLSVFGPKIFSELYITAGCCGEDTDGAGLSSRPLQGIYERGLFNALA
jgi:hypothetical protein